MALSATAALILIFVGHDPQHISMSKGLLHAYHTFRQMVLEMDTIICVVDVPLVEFTRLFRGSLI